MNANEQARKDTAISLKADRTHDPRPTPSPLVP
jgi:hypothetical protein